MKPLLHMAGICAALFLQACDRDTVAGTNNETHTKGTFYQANGKPAVGARVRVYSAAQKETDSTTVQVAQEYVDANGNVALKLKPGHYSLVADSGSISAFIDSVFSDGDKVAIPVDTLRPTGTITGYLRVQPMHSPSIAWVHLMRTNLYTKVDSTGFFRFTKVPAGSLDLVAVSHLPEYTPTHKLVRALPDSTVHVDTIDLVYNGLPLVTGIAATYDSLSGVVTLIWHDTAYARKAGYVIYRQEGASSWASPPERGYTESSIYHDTVFGGFGTTPSRYDSAEFDLTYWVGAKGTDQISRAPIWNKVSLHAKSPCLAARWRVDWVGTDENVPFNTGDIMDTLETGLAIYSFDVDPQSLSISHTFDILGQNGEWNHRTFPGSWEMDGSPVFWKGRVWLVRGCGSTRERLDRAIGTERDTNTYRDPIYDSVRIISSPDGETWDSTTIPVQSDTITSFQLKASATTLVLEQRKVKHDRSRVQRQSTVESSLQTTTGIAWSNILSGSPFPLPPWELMDQSLILRSQEEGSLHVRTSDTVDWTLLAGNKLIPGYSYDTTRSISLPYSTYRMRGKTDLLAFAWNEGFALASPTTPSVWQRVPTPKDVLVFGRPFCFWRGQLVAMGYMSRLHFATITPNQ